jgi:ribosomal protein S18 acetylase RimI-like enzyme
MEIRKATTEDLEALFKLKLKLKNQDISIDPYLKPIEEAKEVYKKYLIRDLKKQGTDRITLVAVKNNKIVGCIRGTLARTLHVLNVTFRGTIDNLFVEKEYRGNSAAKKLIEGVISWFKEKKVDVMTLHIYPSNSKAKSLYKKFGFKEYTLNMNRRL